MSTFNHEIHNEHSVNYPITHKIHNEHSANYLHRPRNTQRTFRKLSTSPTKYTANTPLGVGADSSRPYLPSINSVSVCHHFMGVYIYAGTINRPLQLLTDCDNACEHSANYLRSSTKYTTNIPLNAGEPIHRARIFLLPFHILLQTKSEKSKAGNPKNNK